MSGRLGRNSSATLGRHTYASVLIHAGRSPLAVAAALGHASAETTWKHYARFDEARLAPATDPEASIWEARERVLRDSGLRPSCGDSRSETEQEIE